jgi:hypothetical protein
MKVHLTWAVFYYSACTMSIEKEAIQKYSIQFVGKVTVEGVEIVRETKDLKVRDEIYRLCRELMKLDESWKFGQKNPKTFPSC